MRGVCVKFPFRQVEPLIQKSEALFCKKTLNVLIDPTGTSKALIDPATPSVQSHSLN